MSHTIYINYWTVHLCQSTTTSTRETSSYTARVWTYAWTSYCMPICQPVVISIAHGPQEATWWLETLWGILSTKSDHKSWLLPHTPYPKLYNYITWATIFSKLHRSCQGQLSTIILNDILEYVGLVLCDRLNVNGLWSVNAWNSRPLITLDQRCYTWCLNALILKKPKGLWQQS